MLRIYYRKRYGTTAGVCLRCYLAAWNWFKACFLTVTTILFMENMWKTLAGRGFHWETIWNFQCCTQFLSFYLLLFCLGAIEIIMIVEIQHSNFKHTQ